MKYRRNFRTFVIRKRTISIWLACFIGGSIMGGAFFFSRTIARVSAESEFAEDIYKAALESELPVEKREEKINILEKILGFDIFNPQSILQATPIFEVPDIEYPDEKGSVAKTPVKASEPSVPENNIEEIQVSKGMAVSNATNYAVNAEELADMPMDFALSGEGAEVLVVHTHTTESYTAEGKTTYTQTDSDRSTDSNINIVQVGKKICDVLSSKGIKTIHDTTVHDYPSYNGAYGRSLATVEKNLKANPSIKVVLDVHRDGLVRADGTKLKVSTDINGAKTAQIMLVVGTDAGGLEHDYWKSNTIFASKIQKKANEMYPSLMRPLNLREERFNQHLTKGSLILEVGSNGNTLSEALSGSEYIANVIAEVLKNQ